MFNYYKYKDKFFFSSYEYEGFTQVSDQELAASSANIYYLNQFEPLRSRRSYLVNHPSLLFTREEGIDLLLLQEEDYLEKLPAWIINRIKENKVISINTQYKNWEDLLDYSLKKKWKVNLLALGDVGSTLAIGLRLLGGDSIESIGIYDRNPKRLQRWEYELNQIRKPFYEEEFPPVKIIDRDELFDCHMFIFCASKGIPPVGSQVQDVRMAQFESNSQIIKEYALLARENKFKGIFAVVSDPVDLLCKVAFLESNKNPAGDLEGLASDQILGYGLGVMNARAAYYAEKSQATSHYLKGGRAFGPHGEGLVIADSIENYNEELSDYLTEKTLTANLQVRALGFKPFIAPSLSSGALSLIQTIKGEWFYGSSYMGGAYFGSKCRLKKGHLEIEQLELPQGLFNRLKIIHQGLVDII